MEKIVLIVDPRSLIVNDQNTFSRHQIYAEVLGAQSSKEISLAVLYFSKCRIPKKELSGNLVLYHVPRNFFFALFTFPILSRILKRNTQINVLVAGDPWESLFFARVIRYSLRTKASIQVQVHGDIGSKQWIYANVRNWIRSRTAFFTLRLADQIRTVSESQSDGLIDTYKISRQVMSIVPVPSFLNTAGSLMESKISRPNTLGFVGRIQNDRGLTLFVDLVSKLASSGLDFSIVVVGDGNKKKHFLADLEATVGKSRLSYLGYLTRQEMENCWKRIGVLVSLAPTESFGRTMRESLVHGVPVWAGPSAGARDLLRCANGNEVRLMNIDLPLETLVKDYNGLIKSTVSQETKNILIAQDSTYVTDLINSWITLHNHEH